MVVNISNTQWAWGDKLWTFYRSLTWWRMFLRQSGYAWHQHWHENQVLPCMQHVLNTSSLSRLILRFGGEQNTCILNINVKLGTQDSFSCHKSFTPLCDVKSLAKCNTPKKQSHTQHKRNVWYLTSTIIIPQGCSTKLLGSR